MASLAAELADLARTSSPADACRRLQALQPRLTPELLRAHTSECNAVAVRGIGAAACPAYQAAALALGLAVLRCGCAHPTALAAQQVAACADVQAGCFDTLARALDEHDEQQQQQAAEVVCGMCKLHTQALALVVAELGKLKSLLGEDDDDDESAEAMAKGCLAMCRAAAAFATAFYTRAAVC